MENSTNKKGKLIYRIGFVFFTVCFLVCAIWLVKYFLDNKKAEENMDEITDKYVEQVTTEARLESEEATEPEEPPVDVYRDYNAPQKNIDFAALKEEQNQDIYAWITIPDTQIDYPILQHPTELDYYLDYNIDGSKGYPGCIYTQLINSKDFTDKHTVLYGHNMKNGSMFANLHYFEDPVFFEEHPYFYIYTENQVLVYQIFGAYEFSNAHLLMGFDISSDENFQVYLDNIYSLDGFSDNFNKDVTLDAGVDKIVTLSTCISGKADKRYLVAGKLVASQDAVYEIDERVDE